MVGARHTQQLRCLPIAIAIILFSTAIPVEMRPLAPGSLEFNYIDFIVNVLLYMPLGLSLVRYKPLMSILFGLILSTSIETFQMWCFERHSALFDVIANGLGVAIGLSVAHYMVKIRKITLDQWPVNKFIGVSALIFFIFLLIAVIQSTRQSSLARWDNSYSLLLGNETTSDRPWQGTINTLALVPAAFSQQQVLSLSDLSQGDVKATLIKNGAYVLPSAVKLTGKSEHYLSQEVTDFFYNKAIRHNSFTVIATVNTNNLQQGGPARIISFSKGPFNRNFDLGQEQQQLVFRVSTLTTPDAIHPRVTTPSILQPGIPTTVAATYNGSIMRLYVNGHLYARADLALTPMGEFLPLILLLMGMALAVIAIAFGEPTSPSQRISKPLIAGVIGITLLHIVQYSHQTLPFKGWAPLMLMSGVLCVIGGLCQNKQHNKNT